MKLLKLDARFEDARRIARCLMDSPIKSVVGVDYFRGAIRTYQDREGITQHSFSTDHLHFQDEIKIPIDTLNFCPHLAAKHQVQVRGLQKGILHFGVIRKIAFAKAGPRFRIDSMGGHAMMFRKSSISLNLIQIERGELEGCEIVEVGNE